ncbi:MAG: amino-acid N-acetyltransferase [Gammaproteobacteria bacterium]
MPPSDSVNWLREASRFIRAHRQKTFVVYLGGELLQSPVVERCAEDLLLLAGLGIKLVLVHGARPQIDSVCESDESAGDNTDFVNDIRITESTMFVKVKQAILMTRAGLEAKLSRAALDTVERNSAIPIVGGTFVVARPKGVVAGRDTGLAGEIRRVDAEAINHCLLDGNIVLLSPLAYSSSGEAFNMNALELATAIAGELHANKLILFADQDIVVAGERDPVRQLTLQQARELELEDPNVKRFLLASIRACQQGVQRTHLINHQNDGALMEELFTRDGCGTLVSDTPFDRLRGATIDDIGGILALIEPLEEAGVLVKRSREKLEIEIDHFQVMVREGTVVACGALYEFAERAAEIACIAVHPEYQGHEFGRAMVSALEQRARVSGIAQTFVLTTDAVQWFEELGYRRVNIEQLPVERQQMYNYQRNSVVLAKR